MQKKFRQIIVENVIYYWKFVPYKCGKDPYLLIIPFNFPKAQIKVIFYFKEEGFMLNSGFPVTLNGKAITLNLNQPRFVSEIIGQCTLENIDFFKNSFLKFDGISILSKLGYNWTTW